MRALGLLWAHWQKKGPKGPDFDPSGWEPSVYVPLVRLCGQISGNLSLNWLQQDVPRQDDSTSCGVRCCAAIEHFLAGKEPTVSSGFKMDDGIVAEYRSQMAVRLARHGNAGLVTLPSVVCPALADTDLYQGGGFGSFEIACISWRSIDASFNA